MRIQDEARWRAQKAEMGQQTDPQSAQVFIAFVEEWCDRAEGVLKGSYDPVRGASLISPIEALRGILAPMEARNGYLDAPLLASILAVICANWDCGTDDSLFESMTVFEQRILIEVVRQMTDGLQASAEGEAVPDEAVQLVYGQKIPMTPDG